MKNLKTTATILIMALVSLTAMSCKDSKKEESHETMHSEEAQHNHAAMDHEEMNTPINTMDSNMQNTNAKQVIADYILLKDALVATNSGAAAKAGKKLENTLTGFDTSSYNAAQQKELKDIIADAKEHAEHIGKSEIDYQREHFKTLSQNIMDMVAITGTDTTLYQQFCPMYDKGSAWLSISKDIKNPYYGSKMLTCGSVKKEIN